jgi:uncharacterized protein with von Willebrand factor type A (vWA) domain
MTKLTDEQVAEERTLGLARAWAKVGGEHNADTTCRIARLALALQERLQAAQAERDEAQRERCELEKALEEEIANRDSYEDCITEIAHLLGCKEEWSSAHDHVICAKDAAATIEDRASQQARREAFEEAAGYHDGMAQHWADLLAKLMPGTSDAEEINNARKRALAHARNIRALAEVER